MLAKTICERCEKVYKGGPYSFYCQRCRKVRSSEGGRKAANNKKLKKKEEPSCTQQSK